MLSSKSTDVFRAWQACFWTLAFIFIAAPKAHADALGALASPFERAIESGSFGVALFLVFLAGIATSLTPCVYPMIAITVSVFGANQVKNRLEGAKLSTAFVLGIAALFTPLGLVAALTGGVFGSALANPWVLMGLSLLFVTLALSMFGTFAINLPASWRNRLAEVGGVGLRGAFALGLVSALIAAPCTGPVLGFLLTWVGTSGNVVFGAISLFVYSLGLGLLFWVVGTFSVSLPKSGHWLEWIKSIFGIVMLVAAVYYIRDLVPSLMAIPQHTPRFLAVSVACVLLGIAMGAIHLSFHSMSKRERTRKVIGVAAATIGLCGIVGYLIALPPGAKIEWLHNYDEARARALREHKPLLVDVGASWCGACGELDRRTFSAPLVVAESRRFIAVHIDLSPGKDTPENRKVLDVYHQRGLPLVVLHDKDGSEASRLITFERADVFLKRMQSVQ